MLVISGQFQYKISSSKKSHKILFEISKFDKFFKLKNYDCSRKWSMTCQLSVKRSAMLESPTKNCFISQLQKLKKIISKSLIPFVLRIFCKFASLIILQLYFFIQATEYLGLVQKALLNNLKEKAKNYKHKPLQSIFLINNLNYLTTRISKSELVDVAA